MKLSELLTSGHVLLDFDAPDKWAAIEAIPRALVAAGRLPAALEAPAVTALLERERRMTTGMEHGIAIPHASLDELTEVLGVLAVAPRGIPFETLDGSPGSILWGLLIPRHEKLAHIRTLAAIAETMSVPEVRKSILSSRSVDEVLVAIRSVE